MMTVRDFNGTSDLLDFATGALADFAYGTFISLLQVDTLTGDRSILFFTDSGGVFRHGFYISAQNIVYHTGSGGVGRPSTNVISSTSAWYLIVTRKDTGTTFPRSSVYNYSTDTWAHSEHANTAADAATPPGAGGKVQIYFGTGSLHFNGRIAAAAVWADSLPWSADSSGDTPIENAGLEAAIMAWFAESPDALWLFNQDSVTTDVEDLTGNGADQLSRTGTSVVTDNDPPGFDDSIDSPVDLTDRPTGIRVGGQAASQTVISTVIEDHSLGIRLGGVLQVEITIDVVVLDHPTGNRLAGPSESLAIGTLFDDTPTGVRLSGPAETVTAAPAGSTDLADTPSGVRLSGPAQTLTIDVFLTDRPSGVRLSGPAEAITAAGSGDVTFTDVPTGVRLSGPAQTLTVDVFLTDRPSGVRLSGPVEASPTNDTFFADTPSGVRLSGPAQILTIDTTITDAPSGVRLSGPAGVVELDVIRLDRPGGARLSGPGEGLSAAGPVTMAAIITGIDITGVAAGLTPAITGPRTVSRQARGPRTRSVVIGPRRKTVTVTGAASARALILVTGAGGKTDPVPTGVRVVRTVTGPRLSRQITGPEVGPEG